MMKSTWLAALVVASGALARGQTPVGGPNADEKRPAAEASQDDAILSELSAQRAELDAQRQEIAELKAKQAAWTGSLSSNLAVEIGQNAAPPKASPFAEEIKSKWRMNIYGFVETDFINDTTQGLNDAAGNPAIARDGTLQANSGQTTFGVRNSRLGFKVNAPDTDWVRTSAVLEMDFLGNQSPSSESNAFWNNPTFRIRHMYFVMDTDYVTTQIGQGWELFGWQPYFQPNTVDIQGVPGEVYSRSTKLQFSHKFSGTVDLEPAFAFSRPPERAGNFPDLQAGVKMSFPNWKGVHTVGATGTAVDPAAVGVSACYREFKVPDPATTNEMKDTHGDGIALDAFLPILRPDEGSKANAFSFTGEIAYGEGITDLYTGFTGGASGVAGIGDQGSIGWKGSEIDAIQWRTSIIGLQYYLPSDGSWWVAACYGWGHSNNIGELSATSGGAPFAANTVFDNFQFVNFSLFWDATAAIRFGLSYSQYMDRYVDHVEGTNRRVQFSAFFIF